MPDAVSGVLILDKPVGMSSHTAVQRVRQTLAQAGFPGTRTGHAGTLDPLAGGVLLVLIGRATALSGHAMGSQKTYAAEIVLGVETETDDAEGTITHTAPLPPNLSDSLARVLAGLIGEVEQVPPTYSAIKQGGRRAYAEARKGVQLDLPARTVRVESISLLSCHPPRVRILITTGPGAYIRALARDIGRALDTRAYLHALLRLASGHHTLGEAVALHELTPTSLLTSILPADAAVQHLPAIFLSARQSHSCRHGTSIEVHLSAHDAGSPSRRVVRLYSGSGGFFGLARVDGQRVHPIRILEDPV